MRLWPRSRATLLTAALALLSAGALHAQLSTATVTGVVLDSSGSAIPQASVLLKNVDTSIELRTETNDSGNYVILSVPPGRYTLEFSKASFRSARIQQFTLQVNQTATFNQSLEVGSVGQTIEVAATGELVQSQTAELGAVIAQKQVVDLPLNGRNFTQLLTLTPGVAPVSVSQNSGGFGTNVAAGSQFVFPAINGQTNRSNFFTLDGINNQGAFTSTYAVPPIVDAIQEFKVNSQNDQAEFGMVQGGTINVVSRSGTNELHGTGWWFLRNSAFDARNTFQPAVIPFRQNQFGGAIGGPVSIPKLYNGKNKTFFYLAYQGWRFRRPANAFHRVPTAAELGGDLSNDTRQIFDPFTTRPDPANPGRFTRTPFANNRIPASMLDPGALAYARATLPAPNFSGVGDRNLIDPTPQRQNQEEYSGRLDHTINEKNTVWFRWSGLLQDTSQTGGRPGLLTNLERPARNIGVSWVHVFSPSTVLQLQFGHVNVQENGRTRFTNINREQLLRDIRVSDQFAQNFIGGASFVPAWNAAGFWGGGESNSLNPKLSHIYQYKGNMSKIIGNHQLRWGAEWNYSDFEATYQNLNAAFNTQQTGDGTGAPGSQLASYLLNVPDSAGRRNVRETLRPGGVMGLYFQDTWKVNQKLTVNMGLRYDRTFIPAYGEEDTVGQQGGIEAGSADFLRGVYIIQKLPPSCRERGRAPCIPGDGRLPANVVVSDTGKIYRDTPTNFGPRLGLAYRLTERTALRSSFGIFFDNWAAVTQTSQQYQGAWPDVGQQLANNLNVPTPQVPGVRVRGQNPFPEGLFPAPTPFEQVQWFMDPNFRNPYSMQWQFGVQHQISQDTVITANYVGNGSRRLNLGGYYNVAVTPGPGNPRERAPFPYMAPSFFDRSWGRANYHSFQFQLDKKYRGGLAYQVSYTYSKAIDIGSSGYFGVEGFSVQNPYRFNNDRSVSAFDLTHVLSLNAVYEVPFGKGKQFSTGNKFADYLIGNWNINGLAVIRSGVPYNITVAGDRANTGNTGYLRANLVGDPVLSNPTRQAFFNTAAFQIPAPFTFGNLGRNALRSAGFWNFDMSIFRRFPFGEARWVELRGEAFNLPNATILGTPTGEMTNPNFGRVLGTANAARSLQVGLKIVF